MRAVTFSVMCPNEDCEEENILSGTPGEGPHNDEAKCYVCKVQLNTETIHERWNDRLEELAERAEDAKEERGQDK